jgi:hypothetical protein
MIRSPFGVAVELFRYYLVFASSILFGIIPALQRIIINLLD